MDKMKRALKIITATAMSLMLIFAFAGCGSDPAKEASASLDTTLKALQGADAEALSELDSGSGSLEDSLEAIGGEENMNKLLGALFGHMTYEITDSEAVDDEHVNVKVKLTNVDMSAAVTDWYTDLVEWAMSGDVPSDQNAILTKTVDLLTASVDEQNEAGKTKTEEVTVKLVKEEDGWDLDESDSAGSTALFNALSGGFMNAVGSISNN